MKRSFLYFVIGALAVATAVLGYYFYQERQNTSGISIDVGDGKISVETD
jgi:hypothetical protein